LTIEFIGHIVASGANPAVIKPPDGKWRIIGENDDFCRFINPEAQVLFAAR
jgi:hypothetical protein